MVLVSLLNIEFRNSLHGIFDTKTISGQAKKKMSKKALILVDFFVHLF